MTLDPCLGSFKLCVGNEKLDYGVTLITQVSLVDPAPLLLGGHTTLYRRQRGGHQLQGNHREHLAGKLVRRLGLKSSRKVILELVWGRAECCSGGGVKGRCRVGWGGEAFCFGKSGLVQVHQNSKKKKKDLIEVGAEHYLLKVYYVLDQLSCLLFWASKAVK